MPCEYFCTSSKCVGLFIKLPIKEIIEEVIVMNEVKKTQF